MAILSDLVARVQARIPSDTDYPFKTPTLEQFVLDAINQHNPSYSIDTLPESEEYLVVWLALITVYTTLAAKYAESFSISAGKGDRFGLDQPHIHYMNLAKQLQDQYQKLSMPSIQVSTATRVDLRTGRKTTLFPGDIQ